MFYGLTNFGCKTAQFYATGCECGTAKNLASAKLCKPSEMMLNSLGLELEIRCSTWLNYGRKICTDIYRVSRQGGYRSGAKRRLTAQQASPQPFVTSGNRRMAARLSSVVRCVYCRETAALSCPAISRAIKSETPAAFSIVTAL